MADISMVWFSVGDDNITVDRERLRELIVQYEFPVDLLTRDSKASAFLKACKTATSYVDVNGQKRTLKAVESRRSAEFITFQVITDTGSKLAEYKFFQSRRTREGLVQGTHVVRSVLRRTLDDAERAAAQEWVDTAQAVYDQLKVEAPMTAVRTAIRVGMLVAGVPIVGRECMYFVYADEIHVAHNVRAFMRDVATGPVDFSLVDIDDDSDYQPFADSADEQLTARLETVIARMERGLAPGANMISLRRIEGWRSVIEQARVMCARHERRLSLPLPRTRSALLLADRLMSEIPLRPSFAQ